jgi:hypothetical protein
MILSNFFAGFDWKNSAALIGTVVALGTLIKGTLEYVKQGAVKRAELFLQMRERYTKFFYLLDLLDHQGTQVDCDRLRDLSFEKKLQFLGFYEELAMMVESGLIRTKVAHYMFGYYAIACWDSDPFWNEDEEDRNGPFWRLFSKFVERSRAVGFGPQKFKPKDFQL